MSQDLLQAMQAEAERIEEDAEYSLKGHFFAAERWGQWRYWIGIPTALAAAISSALTFADQTLAGAILAMAATVLATLMTFLNPAERAAQHKAAGSAYLELRNRARIFRQVELVDAQDLSSLKIPLQELDEVRNQLNRTSPKIPQQDYDRAKQAIEDGQAIYRVDKEET
ncbi:MAG: SLATT domain-containing protein [Candidatus Thiodiazotropha sp. (ex. Lucinisca nassula)]|nr:SLATT domain-containing protein [Candidatus Thiodiazotropha sp. (ex. Lucinisca nassula)]MBW9273065.1 SLATT domain-containing protein [Candidatus Thiodiazotropha sp. (ex. Lucinisca nassula)]